MFKAKDQTKFFWIEHWKALLDTCQMFGPHGISQSEGRLIFAWSQTIVKDELKKRQRAVSLLWFDFLEVSRPRFSWQLVLYASSQFIVIEPVPSKRQYR